MTADLKVLVEQGPKGKRWVAVAVDWPGLERGARDEEAAVAKLREYVPRYRRVAERAGLGEELRGDPKLDVIGRYTGTGSTDFWGISFAPSDLDRVPIDEATFERQATLLRAAWAEFDAIGRSCLRRPAPRPTRRRSRPGSDHPSRPGAGIGRLLEAGQGARRVRGRDDAEGAGSAPRPVRGRDACLVRRGSGPLGNWTIPYLLRHTAYHALDHAWEMEDRDLTG